MALISTLCAPHAHRRWAVRSRYQYRDGALGHQTEPRERKANIQERVTFTGLQYIATSQRQTEGTVRTGIENEGE